MSSPLLLVLCGPTASGKTSLAIRLAEEYDTEVISSDSRQFYKGLNIGTAKPDAQSLLRVRHHFIDSLSLEEEYNSSRYEHDALACLAQIFEKRNIAILAGGSGLYVQAVCQGFDRLPESDPILRSRLRDKLAKEGLEKLQEQLSQLDPEYYRRVDPANPHRLIRALEVCLLTGKKYSELRKGKSSRDFRIFKIGLEVNRDLLYRTIDARVDGMMEAGLEAEARQHLPFRNANALNTVGYKELFEYFDGKTDRATAILRIKQNTRRYAKRQLTWFRRDPDIRWFDPAEVRTICEAIDVQRQA